MSTKTQEPPAKVVARDAHWSDKMARLRERKPMEHAVTLWLDDDSKHMLQQAEAAVAAARTESEQDPGDAEKAKSLRAAEKAAEAARAAAGDAQVTVTLRGLPRNAYEQLIVEHPPTGEQRTRDETYNVETFAPALVAACSVDGMPVEDAEWLLSNLSQSEAGLLFQTAVTVCTAARLDLGKGSGPTSR